MLTPLPHPDLEVELVVSDRELARAWFEGVPAARLLARVRVAREADDAEEWAELAARLLGEHADRVDRLLVRHLRSAQDEGALPAPDAVVAVLMLAVAARPEGSLGEIFADGPVVELPTDVLRAVSGYEPRLGASASARRAAAFETCLRLAARRSAGPWPQRRVLGAARAFGASALGPFLTADASTRLLPHDVDESQSRVVLVAREPLEALALRDPRELAQHVAAVERDEASLTSLDSLVADVLKLLDTQGDLLLCAPPRDPELAASLPSVRPSEAPVSSTMLDWTTGEGARALAAALEANVFAPARARQIVQRGGEQALDAIGAEMLKVTDHPLASAAFAEVLAKSGRPRDVMRLVTYFAVTPDPLLAARALGECEAPELPGVLRAWLEAMLPPPGEEVVPAGDDPGTSGAARVAACVSSLEPYPRLYGAVRPLLSRVSVAPPPPSG